MQATLIVTLVLHVLSGVFWAGSTFALARIGGDLAERLFRPQMAAATVAIVTGGVLGFLLHRGTPGIQEYLLAVGALCAMLAAGVQGASAQVVRQLSAGDAIAASSGVAISQRIAAALLAITVICMAAARYA